MGMLGRAWRVCLEANPATLSLADLAHWVVERPRAGPRWHSYAVVLFHLRFPEAHRCFPAATHEFWFAALYPQTSRQQYISTGAITQLGPAVFASQIQCPTDGMARDRVYRRVVRAVCDGRLSPADDDRPAWVKQFGDHMTRSAP